MLGIIATIYIATIGINQFLSSHELSGMELKIDGVDMKIEAIGREVQCNRRVIEIEAQAMIEGLIRSGERLTMVKEKMIATDAKLGKLLEIKKEW